MWLRYNILYGTPSITKFSQEFGIPIPTSILSFAFRIHIKREISTKSI